MTSNGDKWQLAFWLITIISGVWLMGLTGGVVENDRLRQQSDQLIMCQVENYQREVIQRLTRIETKLEKF